MNPHLENYNYWNDPRTIAGMVGKPKIVEEKGNNYILWEEYQEDDSTITHKLLCKWEVCDLCRGNGKHVNQSIDCNGLTAEDFYEDPDFFDDYCNGVYDVICNECKGRRVVPVLDENNNDADLVKRYHEYQQDQYNDARMSAAERAMGA